MATRYHFVRPAQSVTAGPAVHNIDRVQDLFSEAPQAVLTSVLDAVQDLPGSDAMPSAIAVSRILANPFDAAETSSLSLTTSPVVQSPLSETEDHRTFQPTPDTVLRSTSRSAVRYEAASPIRASYLPHGITPQYSSYVLICIRRKNRRAAILSSGRGGTNKPPVRNPRSDIWC